MSFRYFPSGLHHWKIIFVLLMYLPSRTGKTNFYPVNSCTDIRLKEIPVEVFQSCLEADKTIHCLPDENKNLGLSCFAVTWISEAKCPSYNSYQGNLDEIDCSTDHNGECPVVQYKSPLSVNYTGCYIKELIRAKTTTLPMTTETMTTKTPTTSNNPTSDPTADVSIIAGKKSKPNQSGVVDGGNKWMIAFIIILVLALVAVCVCCLLLYKRKVCAKCKKSIREEFFRFLPAKCHNQNDSADAQPHDNHDGSNMRMVQETNGSSK